MGGLPAPGAAGPGEAAAAGALGDFAGAVAGAFGRSAAGLEGLGAVSGWADADGLVEWVSWCVGSVFWAGAFRENTPLIPPEIPPPLVTA